MTVATYVRESDCAGPRSDEWLSFCPGIFVNPFFALQAVFQHLAKKGYQGVISMEHGNAKPGAEGEQAVIGAYRAADAFNQ